VVQAVTGSPPYAEFAYTVGLTELDLPELVVTGLRADRAAGLLDQVAAHSLHAGPPPAGERLVVVERELEVVELPHPDAHLSVAVALYGEGVRAVQLVWRDDDGRWPWECGHRGGRGGQPVLDPRSPMHDLATWRQP
jgi:hypothetical protein